MSVKLRKCTGQAGDLGYGILEMSDYDLYRKYALY
jgi:hypothetical protein